MKIKRINNIAKRRALTGLSQVEFAKATKVNLMTIRQLEKQHHDPSFKTIRKLSNYFNISPYQLFD